MQVLLILCLVVPLAFGWRKSHSVKIELVKRNVTQDPLKQHDIVGLQLLNRNDIEYHGLVSVGTPPKTYRVIYDTGSDVFWLPKTGCQSSRKGTFCLYGRGVDGVYDPKKSSTSESTSERFSRKYGTGYVQGTLYNDKFWFGDASNPSKSIALNGLITFGAGERMTEDDVGILGLGFPAGDVQATSIMQQAVQQGVLDEPIFTTFMKKCGKEICEDGGQITLGAEDKDNCGSVQHYVNVVDDSIHWEFVLDGVKANGQEVYGHGTAITDTGSSIISLPADGSLAKLASSLGAWPLGDGSYALDCSSNFELTFRIGVQDFTIPAEQMLLKMSRGDKCRLAAIETSYKFWVLGTPFIRTFCQIHNVEKKTVGFARALHSDQGTKLLNP